MKKTLIAVAALSAMAASAMAANVTVYGVVDTGLQYQHIKDKINAPLGGVSESTNKFAMAAGQNSGNRIGFKGIEDFGNGAKVGFILENGFNSDDGKLGQGGRLFGREANLYVTTNFGTLSFARVGALTSGTGSYHLTKYAPFGSGWGGLTAQKSSFWIGDRDRMDNTVTYVSPSLAGVKAYAQYSFARNGQEVEGNERQNDRYAGLGLSFNQGAFSTALVVDSVLYNYKATSQKDSLGVTWGASYDFGVAKLFAQAQYGKHENKFGLISDVESAITEDEGLKGFDVSLGVTAPICGGTLYAQASYLDSKSHSEVSGVVLDQPVTVDKVKAKNWGIGLGYSYPFSKRTFAYTYAAYNQLKTTVTVQSMDLVLKEKQTEVGIGLVHKF